MGFEKHTLIQWCKVVQPVNSDGCRMKWADVRTWKHKPLPLRPLLHLRSQTVSAFGEPKHKLVRMLTETPSISGNQNQLRNANSTD